MKNIKFSSSQPFLVSSFSEIGKGLFSDPTVSFNLKSLSSDQIKVPLEFSHVKEIQEKVISHKTKDFMSYKIKMNNKD